MKLSLVDILNHASLDKGDQITLQMKATGLPGRPGSVKTRVVTLNNSETEHVNVIPTMAMTTVIQNVLARRMR